MKTSEIAKVALAIGNKLHENRISISLILAGELAEVAIKAYEENKQKT